MESSAHEFDDVDIDSAFQGFRELGHITVILSTQFCWPQRAEQANV